MKVSRSGYYKWLKNKDILNQYEINRKDLGELIKDIHKRKPSYGYHRIRKIIIEETGWVVSANLVHKVCKILKIKSKTPTRFRASASGTSPSRSASSWSGS